VDPSTLMSGKDTLLLSAPLIIIVFLSAFRLDQIIARPKRLLDRKRSTRGMDGSGEPFLCDPDGRPSGLGRRKQVRKDDMRMRLPSRVDISNGILQPLLGHLGHFEPLSTSKAAHMVPQSCIREDSLVS
jgi:hypothetical protein